MARLELSLRDPDTGTRTSIFTTWQQFTCQRVVNGLGGYALVLGGSYADMIELRTLFALDTILEVWRADTENGISKYKEGEFLHRDYRIYQDAEGWHFISVGAGLNDLLKRTHVQAPANTSQSIKSGKAETVLKAFWNQELGPGAGSRAREDLTIEADGGTGNSLYDVNGFNTNLLDLSQRIAEIGGGDFDLIGDGAGGVEARWYAGQRGMDRRGSVLFATSYNNMRYPSWEQKNSEIVNSILVLGQGEGADRQHVLVEDATSIAKSKWNRLELARDARDTDSSDELAQRGQEQLEKNWRKETVGFEIVQTAGWLYGRDYFFGDLARARVLDASLDIKIQGVTITQDAGQAEMVGIETSNV